VVRAAVWPPPAPSRRDLLAGVARLRAGDASPAGEAKPNGKPNGPTGPNGRANGDGTGPRVIPMDPAGSLAVLRDAVSARRPVWISYLEDADRTVQARIQPLGVEAGRVRAVELSTGRLRLYPVHRVIGAAADPATA
jgi:hypothetical protein